MAGNPFPCVVHHFILVELRCLSEALRIISFRKANKFATICLTTNSRLTIDVTGNTIKPMNTTTKLLEAMRNNPRDWRIGQLRTVAGKFAVVCRCEGGSHHVFSHPDVAGIVSVPAHRPIKPIYVRQFVELIDKAKESQA